MCYPFCTNSFIKLILFVLTIAVTVSFGLGCPPSDSELLLSASESCPTSQLPSHSSIYYAPQLHHVYPFSMHLQHPYSIYVVAALVESHCSHPAKVLLLPPLQPKTITPRQTMGLNRRVISAPPPHLSPLYLIAVSRPPSSPSPPSLLLLVVIFVCDSLADPFAVHANHQRGVINLTTLAHCQCGKLPAIPLATRASGLPAVALSSVVTCPPSPSPRAPATRLRLPLSGVPMPAWRLAHHCPCLPHQERTPYLFEGRWGG